MNQPVIYIGIIGKSHYCVFTEVENMVVFLFIIDLVNYQAL